MKYLKMATCCPDSTVPEGMPVSLVSSYSETRKEGVSMGSPQSKLITLNLVILLYCLWKEPVIQFKKNQLCIYIVIFMTALFTGMKTLE